jgi:hypothetical protein
MDRIKHLDRFYDMLQTLEGKTGTRMLASSDNHMDWPQQGICFFLSPENGGRMASRCG